MCDHGWEEEGVKTLNQSGAESVTLVNIQFRF